MDEEEEQEWARENCVDFGVDFLWITFFFCILSLTSLHL